MTQFRESKLNPGWPSRIYSNDGQTELSLIVNQAMILSSLIRTCASSDDICPIELKNEIDGAARSLIDSQELNFDSVSGLYRIPYGIAFRFDGVWAPWNWQMTWASILRHIGHQDANDVLKDRAEKITSLFLSSWKIRGEEEPLALWRYWPNEFYAGWSAEESVSRSLPRRPASMLAAQRYEDTNHGGLSLFGLSDVQPVLGTQAQEALGRTLDAVLERGVLTSRDIDGSGPVGPEWFPGGGWAFYATPGLSSAYTKRLPGSTSADHIFVYATLFDPTEAFELVLKSYSCHWKSGCQYVSHQRYSSMRSFLEDNVFFSVRESSDSP